MADDVRANIDLNIDTSKALSGLKALQSQLSALHTQLSSLGPAQRSSAGAIQRQLVDNINATGKFAASMTTVKTTAESFTTALEKNKLTMGEYFRYAGGASKSFGRNFAREFATIEKVAVERVKTLQTQYIKLGRDANGAMKAIAVRPLALDMDNLQTKTAIAAQKQLLLNQLLKQGSTQMLNWGKNTQWAGRQLMVGFTIPLGIFAGQAMKAFSDMEKQIIAFKRVYGDLSTSAKDTDAMAESIKNLATEFTKYGLAVSDTMEMASKAAAMGKTGADLLGQVQQASKLAVLGQVEQQQALQTTISLTDTFGTAAEDLGKKINFLNAVENQTAVSIEDLTIAIPKAGPVIKQLGGDVEDLAFFLTAMREGGINASEGANALKSGLAAMINPTGKAAEMLEGFGINLQKIVKTNKGDVRGTVVEFAKALDTLDPLNRAKAIEQLFGKFQFSRISTLMKNVISDTSQASTTAQLAQRSSIELAAMAAREMRKISSSPLFKFQKALQDFQTQLAPIGEAFMKFVTPIIDWVNGMLKAFNSLSDGTKTFIVGFTSVVAGLGPILLMTFGLIANGFANLIKGFTALKSMFNKVQTSSQILGQETSYMTQEQMKAKAVAASLDQVHGKLIQTFNVEAGSVNKLAAAYERAVVASQRLVPVATGGTGGKGKPKAPKKFAQGGVIKGPGTGTSDSISAMVSNGEAIIPAKSVSQNRSLVESLISGNVPKFARGGIINRMFVGMPKSFKAKSKEREAATQISQSFMSSSKFRKQEPEDYMGQVSPTSGHSFPIFGLGGVYKKRSGEKVFVKPVMDDVGALGELRATIIGRQAHGLVTPQQRIVVMKDPTDRRGQRRFLALESPLDPRLASPTGKFTKKEYFKQLLASTLRGDKDLSPDNVYGNVLPDVGTAGVFNRASGLRAYEANMPSIEEQATINLLGVKGGAKKAFAQSTADMVRSMKPEAYAKAMQEEIEDVLPKLKQTINSLGLDSIERPYYESMIQRLEAARGIDWTKFHQMHSQVAPPLPTQAGKKLAGFAKGGIIRGPGTGTSDSIPALVSNGEFIMPAKQTAKYRPFLDAMSRNEIPRFAGKNGNVAGEDKKTDRKENRSRNTKTVVGNYNLYKSASRSAPPSWSSYLKKNPLPGWEGMQQEEMAAIEAARAHLRAQGVPESKIDRQLRNISGVHLSHLNPSYETVSLGAGTQPIERKVWSVGEVSPDLAAYNEYLKTITGRQNGKYLEGLDLQSLASSAGIDVRTAKKQMALIQQGQHPQTAAGFKLLAAIGAQDSDPNSGYMGRAVSAAVGASGGGRKGYLDALGKGQLRLPEHLDESAKRDADKLLTRHQGHHSRLTGGSQAKDAPKKPRSRKPVQSKTEKDIEAAKKSTAKSEKSVAITAKQKAENAKKQLRLETKAAVEKRRNGEALSRREKTLIKQYDSLIAERTAKSNATRAANKTATQATSQARADSNMRLYGHPEDPTPEEVAAKREQRNTAKAERKAAGRARAEARRKANKVSLFGMNKASQNRRVNAASRISGGAAMGVGMGISMAGSAAGMVIGGDVGNTIANVSGVAGTVAMVAGSFQKATAVVARFLPYIGLATVAFGGLALVVDKLGEAERKRIKQSKDTADALDMTEEKSDVLSNFFGKSVSGGGVLNSAASMTNLTDPQEEAVKELRLSDEFKGVYATAIQALRSATKEEGDMLLENIALQLSPNFADEEIEVIVDALRQEAGRTDLKLDFASIDVSTDEGFERTIERLKRAGQDVEVALESNKSGWFSTSNPLDNMDGIGGDITPYQESGVGIPNPFDPNQPNSMDYYAGYVKAIKNAQKELEKAYAGGDPAKIKAAQDSLKKLQDNMAYYIPDDVEASVKSYTEIFAAAYDAVKADLDSGKITVEEYTEKIKELDDQILAMESNSREVLMYTLIEALPEGDLKNGIKGLSSVSDQLLAIRAAAVNAGEALALVMEIAQGEEIGGPTGKMIADSARAKLAALGASTVKTPDNPSPPGPAAEDPRITAANKKIDKYQTGLDYIETIEDKINDKYDDRLEALDKIQEINDQISQQQRDQLDLADALARGDIGAAARASQNMRANENNLQIQRQKDALDSARRAELDAVTDPLGRTRSYLEGKIDALEKQIARIEFWKVNKKAKGGMISHYEPGGKVTGPGTGTSDDIPAMLSNGEYVIRAKAVKALGVDTLDKMNHAEKFGVGGFARRFANGGIVNKYAIGGEVDGAADLAAARKAIAARKAAAAARKAAKEKKDREALAKAGGPLGHLLTPEYLDYQNELALQRIRAERYAEEAAKRASVPAWFTPDAWYSDLMGLHYGATNTPNIDKSAVPAARWVAGVYTEQLTGSPWLAGQVSGVPVEPSGWDALALSSVLPIPKLGLLNSARMAVKPSTVIKPSMIPGLTNTEAKIFKSTMYNKKTVTVGEDVVPTYKIKGDDTPVVFQGQGQDFSDVGARVVQTTPEGLLGEAIRINPQNVNAATMLSNFKKGKIGEREQEFLDNVYSAIAINRKGGKGKTENTDGFAEILSSLNGNQNATNLVNFKTGSLRSIVEENAARERDVTKQMFGGLNSSVTPDLSSHSIIHSTQYPIVRNADGDPILYTHGTHNLDGVHSRASIHFTVDAPVADHYAGSWDPTNTKIVSPLSSVLDKNGLPYNFKSIDTWWMKNPGEALVMPDASVIKTFPEQSLFSEELIARGLLKPGGKAPLITLLPDTKEAFQTYKPSYTAAEREELSEILGKPVLEGQEFAMMDRYAMEWAKTNIGTNPAHVGLGQHSLNSEPRQAAVDAVANLLGQSGVRGGIHSESLVEILERPLIQYGAYGRTASKTGEFPTQLWSADSIEALRTIARLGKFTTFRKKNLPPIDRVQASTGGLIKNGSVMPSYFANGGIAGPRSADAAERWYNKSATKAKSKPKAGSRYVPKNTPKSTNDMIGYGMGMAMDEIWKAITGPFTNEALRHGNITTPGVDDAWALAGLIPFGKPAAGAARVASNAAKSNQFSRTIRAEEKARSLDPNRALGLPESTNQPFRDIFGPGTKDLTYDVIKPQVSTIKGAAENVIRNLKEGNVPNVDPREADRLRQAAEAYLKAKDPLSLFNKSVDAARVGAQKVSSTVSDLYKNRNIVGTDLLGDLVSRGVKDPAKAEALRLLISGVHMSRGPITETLPSGLYGSYTARMYGPGTYFSQNAKAASKTEIYGSYPHRHSLTPSSITKTLKSKGFINPKQMGAKIEEFFGPNVGNAEEAYSDVLTLMPVKHPFIQGLIKEGYLGYKYGNSFTNWALGSDKSFKFAGSRVPRRANGGLISKVKPSYFNDGGLARGTDTIPAMLTPGEFVMSRSAVDNFGVDNLKAINAGDVSPATQQTSIGDSVYNSNSYSISVNVSSASDPNDIARTVMQQIERIDSQRMRGNRY
jgi:TP901 family phage tail tape measure protein